jgi:hypothetical protein
LLSNILIQTLSLWTDSNYANIGNKRAECKSIFQNCTISAYLENRMTDFLTSIILICTKNMNLSIEILEFYLLTTKMVGTIVFFCKFRFVS